MGIILKIASAMLHTIASGRVCNAIEERIKSTKRVMKRTKALRAFWTVVFFPLELILDMAVALVRTLLIWVLPRKTMGHIQYLIKLFIMDKTVRNMDNRVALKRIKLCIELFTKGAEKRMSYGDKNPDIIFFVIRPYYFMKRNELATSLSDLLFHYYRNLQHLSYAVNKGWIPVVDWENYGPFRHGEDYPVNGTRNCWEYYWKQPSEYTLEEVYSSKNVILSDRNSIDYGYIPTLFITPPLSNYARQLALKCPQYDQLFQLNEFTENYISERERTLFPPDSKILGVSIRGMAYGQHYVPGHPIQPKITELINSVIAKMEEWKMDYIFFACESAAFVEIMKNTFGKKLIFLQRERYKEEPIEDDSINPLYIPGHRYQTNLDYLTEMVLLSRCSSLMAGMSGGVRAAIIWNANQYEHLYIFEKGLW